MENALTALATDTAPQPAPEPGQAPAPATGIPSAPVTGTELDMLLAAGTLSVPEATRCILEDTLARGLPVPSIRAIRGRIGRGGLGTISQVVTQWKTERLQSERQTLAGFSDEDGRGILAAIWERVFPVIAREIDAVEQDAQNRVAIEKGEAAKIREAAEDALAAADRREATIRDLREQVAALTSAQDTVRREAAEQVAKKDAELADVRKERDTALQEVTRLTAERDTLRAVLPLLESQYRAQVTGAGKKEDGQQGQPAAPARTSARPGPAAALLLAQPDAPAPDPVAPAPVASADPAPAQEETSAPAPVETAPAAPSLLSVLEDAQAQTAQPADVPEEDAQGTPADTDHESPADTMEPEPVEQGQGTQAKPAADVDAFSFSFDPSSIEVPDFDSVEIPDFDSVEIPDFDSVEAPDFDSVHPFDAEKIAWENVAPCPQAEGMSDPLAPAATADATDSTEGEPAEQGQDATATDTHKKGKAVVDMGDGWTLWTGNGPYYYMEAPDGRQVKVRWDKASKPEWDAFKAQIGDATGVFPCPFSEEKRLFIVGKAKSKLEE